MDINRQLEYEMIKLGKYIHYKGNKYEVIGTATHSETLEKMVVYRALYDDVSLWVRSYEMFLEEVNKNGQKYRFELQNIKSVGKE